MRHNGFWTPGRKILGLALPLALGAGCAAGSDPGPTLDDALAAVTPESIRTHVHALAHDSMRGRDTDDVGFELARDYVEAEFARLGLEPAFDGSYLQPFELLEVEADAGSRMTVDGVVFEFPDVVFTPDWLGDRPTIDAEGVYLGHDVVTGSSSEAVDLTGRIAFVLAGTPEGRADEIDIAQRDRAEVELALSAGAVAVVVLNPDANPQAWRARATPRRPVRVLADGTSPSLRPTSQVGPEVSRRLIAQWTEGSLADVSIERRHRIRRTQSWNVAAVLPGSDAALADEAVVFTAHLDHVGVGARDLSGDSIYNGAHDNALGIGKVLSVAEAMRNLDLRRSMLFLATGAEESGLLGAWYYVKNPPISLENTAAAINHDGGLIAGAKTDDVFAWGPQFSSIETDVAWAATETGMRLDLEPTAPFAPSAGLMYRSDHYPFLVSGVPIVYIMPGFTVAGDPEAGRQAWLDYLGGTHHVQADNVDPAAEYESPVALTALSVRLAWRLANADGTPTTHADAPIAKHRGPPDGRFFRP